jgi:hypothetical protein
MKPCSLSDGVLAILAVQARFKNEWEFGQSNCKIARSVDDAFSHPLLGRHTPYQPKNNGVSQGFQII